jgi:hypothetical protein
VTDLLSGGFGVGGSGVGAEGVGAGAEEWGFGGCRLGGGNLGGGGNLAGTWFWVPGALVRAAVVVSVSQEKSMFILAEELCDATQD